jgi:membrane-associated phospholipid phosphatase
MLNRTSIYIALAIVGTLVMVAALSWFGQRPLPGDLAVSHMVQGMLARNSVVGRAFARVDNLVWASAVLVIVSMALLRRIAAAVWLGLAVATSMALGDVLIKPLVARPRPSADLVQISQVSDSYGFPSTTTLVAVVLGGLLIYLVRREPQQSAHPARMRRAVRVVMVGAIGLIVLTSVSRIYAGEHWPSDVLGSWLVGSCWTLCLIGLHGWWTRRVAARQVQRT